jgi:hypothetical protein
MDILAAVFLVPVHTMVRGVGRVEGRPRKSPGGLPPGPIVSDLVGI